MKVKIELTEKDLRDLVHTEICKKLGNGAHLAPENIKIEVKSKQNFRAEWEVAAFRAVYDGDV